MNIKQIKEKVRRLKLANQGLSAREILIKQKFVLGIISKEFVDELPEGCYLKKGKLRTVLIREDLNDHQANVVYTHELIHSQLHPEINTEELDSYDPVLVKKIELEADTGTAEFLLDNNIFKKHVDKSIYEIACIEHVPVELVELKLKNLDKSYLYNSYNYDQSQYF